MTNTTSRLSAKANELGLPENFMACALNIITQNRNLVNAMDRTGEMDDYIYRAILTEAFAQRKARAEANLYAEDPALQREAQKDLTLLRREELTSDVFYRAVLPLLVKVLRGAPILRLHAEEASRIVLQLADVKRKNRTVSLTELIVKKFPDEISV